MLYAGAEESTKEIYVLLQRMYQEGCGIYPDRNNLARIGICVCMYLSCLLVMILIIRHDKMLFAVPLYISKYSPGISDRI